MDSPPISDKVNQSKTAAKPSIDTLRTVEFRTTIRGYHMDDVDEYLERVAVEAEELQEQARLSSDRFKQVAERVAGLEQQLEQARRIQQSAPPPSPQPVERAEPVDEAQQTTELQRTLLLAQKFVDQTRAEAENDARTLISDSETRARKIVTDAEEHARVMIEEAERNLRDEVKRLDAQRAELVEDVETIARHLEVERSRIRTALTDMLSWVDEHVQPPDTSAQVMEPEKTGSSPRDRFSSDSRSDVPHVSQSSAEPGNSGSGSSRDDDAPVSSPEPSTASSTRDDSSFGGPPTELIDSTVGALPDDDLDEPTGQVDTVSSESIRSSANSSERIVSERSVPGHQRQMFAPGRDPAQAESGAIR